MKVFLSSRYSRREELKRVRTVLQQHGHEVCSRWLDTEWNETEREGEVYSSAAPPERRREYATIDVDDVKACNVFIAFTEQPRSSSRGGRHVETGIALGLGKRIIVVGPQENIFYHHPSIEYVMDIVDCVQNLITILSRG